MIFYILKKCLLFTLHYFFFNFIHLFLATWVFVVAGLSLVVVSGGTLSLLLAGFSLQWLLLWQSLGTRPVGFTSFSLLALWQVQSSQTRDWTRVPCIGRQTLNPGPPGKPCPHHSPHPCSPLVLLTSLCSSNIPAVLLSQSLSLHVIFPPTRFFLHPPHDLLLHFVQVSGSVARYQRGCSKSPCTKQRGPVLLYHPASGGVFLVIFMAACPLALVGDAAYVMTEAALKLR